MNYAYYHNCKLWVLSHVPSRNKHNKSSQNLVFGVVDGREEIVAIRQLKHRAEILPSRSL